MYDFDQIIVRRGTNCSKWDNYDRILGLADMIHVGCADMDFKAPEPIIQSVHHLAEHGIFGYSEIFDDFYQAIIRYYAVHHQTQISAQDIVFCPRINIACGLCTEAFTRPYDEVIIHSPSYPPLRQAVIENGRKLIEVPLNYQHGAYSLTLLGLQQALSPRSRMVILVNPHNPSTRVFSKAELDIVADFCIEHDLILFVDEIHGDLCKQGVEFLSIINYATKYKPQLLERLILANSPAKSFNMPGMVGSYMIICNQKLQQKVRAEISRIGEHNPNIFFNAALISAYTQCDDYLTQVREYIDKNEQYIVDNFKRLFPQAHIVKREGSYLLWIDMYSYFQDEKELKDFFIKQCRIGILSESIFDPNKSDNKTNFMRFNLATPHATLEHIIKRIENVLNHQAYNAI